MIKFVLLADEGRQNKVQNALIFKNTSTRGVFDEAPAMSMLAKVLGAYFENLFFHSVFDL